MGAVHVASKKVSPAKASTAKDVEGALRKLADPDRAAQMQRFFKTGPGEYGSGDKMLGISVPLQRAVARQYKDIAVADALTLLHSPWHEVRLTALFLLVHRFQKGDAAQRRIVFDGYLANLAHVNNWDLVDSSAPYIVGGFTANNPMPLLKRLVKSKRLWDRRVAAISTLHHLTHGSAIPTVFVATALCTIRRISSTKPPAGCFGKWGSALASHRCERFWTNTPPRCRARCCATRWRSWTPQRSCGTWLPGGRRRPDTLQARPPERRLHVRECARMCAQSIGTCFSVPSTVSARFERKIGKSNCVYHFSDPCRRSSFKPYAGGY